MNKIVVMIRNSCSGCW